MTAEELEVKVSRALEAGELKHDEIAEELGIPFDELRRIRGRFYARRSRGGGKRMSDTNGGSPPAARHGVWRLQNARDEDKRIRERLARGDSVEEIADAVGVATGYIEALIRDDRAEEVGHGPPPPADAKIAELLEQGAPHREISATLGVSHDEISRVRKTLGLNGKPGPLARHKQELPAPPRRDAEPVAVATRVRCIVTGGELAVRECLQRQSDEKCFCPKASTSILALRPIALPGTRLMDQLDRAADVARSVLTKPDLVDRHLGPARLVYEGKPVERTLIAGELPTKPSAPPVKRSPLQTYREANPRPRAVSQVELEDDDDQVEQLDEAEPERPEPDEVAEAVEATRAARSTQEQPASRRTEAAHHGREAQRTDPAVLRLQPPAAEAAGGVGAVLPAGPQHRDRPAPQRGADGGAPEAAGGEGRGGARVDREGLAGARGAAPQPPASRAPNQSKTPASPPAPKEAHVVHCKWKEEKCTDDANPSRGDGMLCKRHHVIQYQRDRRARLSGRAPEPEPVAPAPPPEPPARVPAAAQVSSVGGDDDFARMRRILADFRALGDPERDYVFKRLTADLPRPALPA